MPDNGKIYPPKSFYLYTYPLVIIIGEPFYCGEEESEAAFTERVRQWFVTQAQHYENS